MSSAVSGGSRRGFGALVRRKRDGRVAIELDLVHAGVVTEAVLQTRTLLAGVDGPAADPGSGDRPAPGRAGPGESPTPPGDGSPGSEGGAPGPSDTAGGPPADSAAAAAAAEGQRSVDDEFAAIVAGLAAGDGEEQAPASDDPALRRLLPDAYLDDPAASAEFRRLSADSVRGRKVAALDAVLADLAELRQQAGGVVLEQARARSWLTALNDARLALGTRLALTESDNLDAELAEYEARVLAAPDAEDDEETATRAYRIAVYGFLSELLEMTVRALDR